MAFAIVLWITFFKDEPRIKDKQSNHKTSAIDSDLDCKKYSFVSASPSMLIIILYGLKNGYGRFRMTLFSNSKITILLNKE